HGDRDNSSRQKTNRNLSNPPAAPFRSFDVRYIWNARVGRATAYRSDGIESAASQAGRIHSRLGVDAVVLCAVGIELHGQSRRRQAERFPNAPAVVMVR